MSASRGGGNRGHGQPRGRGGRGGGAASPSGLPRGGSPSTSYQSSGGRGGFRGRGSGGGPGPPRAVTGDAVFGSPPSVDQCLSSSELIKTLKTIPYDSARPTRPGFGTLGKPGVLRANFFPIKFPKTGVIYDHHIEVTPKTDLKSIETRLFTLLEQSTHPGWQEYVPFIAHDGSARLVSSRRLPQPLDVPVLLLREAPGRHDKTYTFSITFTQELRFSELDSFIKGDPISRYWDFAPILSAHNLVLRYHASHNGVRVGRNRYFFPSNGQPLRLSIGVEAWRGFFMSTRPVYKELMVNVGVCMTAFYEPGNLAAAIMNFQQQSRGAMLQRFAQKFKVTTSHLGYRQMKPLKRIMPTTARGTSFQCDEFNATMTVEQYFQRKYNITLEYPNLPVVDISGPGARRPIYVPPELCEILPGQPFRGKLDDEQTARLHHTACKRPVENAQAILNQGIPQLGLTPNNQKLTNFGVEVSPSMAVVPFRELPPPGVSYKDGKPPNVNNGSWNILDVKFHIGGVVKSWWILTITEQRPVFNGHDDPRLIVFWKGFAEKCQRSGMTGITPYSEPALLNVNLVDPTTDPGRQRSLNLINSTIRTNQAQRGTPSFVLVVLSKRDNYIYPGIKRICDVELGIHTVHTLSDNLLTRQQDQYFSNVALKVNTKLGGINHKIDDRSLQWLTKTKTMLVGMDVTHPGPGSIDGTPSIAAVVASVDGDFAQFPASVRCQESKKEMITDLSAMMIERLKRYQEVSTSLPDRVYVFRSGVSHGHFDHVLSMELPLIIDAFKRVPNGGPQGKPYRPQLTIVICGKRHHARMWPPDALGDKNGNLRPGTVVDQGITSLFDFDFYLQACPGPQGHGIVKPTHYTVLYDESRLGADELQQGINTASYLYARATKAVSLIPPVVYADLACRRGRCYLGDLSLSVPRDMTTTTANRNWEEESRRVFDAAEQAWGNGIHPNLAESMFYV